MGLLFGSGSGVDHGILLCCYFVKINIKAWLLLGSSVSRGEAAYVLTSRTLPDNPVISVYDIWDPLTGQKYSTCDSFSPIQEVYCLINVENVIIYFCFFTNNYFIIVNILKFISRYYSHRYIKYELYKTNLLISLNN